MCMNILIWATKNIDFPTSDTQLVFAGALVSAVVSVRICDGEIKSHMHLEKVKQNTTLFPRRYKFFSTVKKGRG